MLPESSTATAHEASGPNGPLIALVIRRLIGRSGGAQRLYCELADMLADAGYQVACLHYDEREGAPPFPMRHRIERINLAPAKTGTISHLHTKALSLLRRTPVGRLTNGFLWARVNGHFIGQLAQFYRHRQPALVIGFLPPANTAALAASRVVDVPVIVTNHSVPAEDYLSPRRWDPNPVDRKLRLELLAHATRIHVLSRAFAGWFPRELRDRIVVIPNYVSPGLGPAPQSPVVRKKTILAVGRLVETKNYGVLLEAWGRLAPRFPDWQVVIYGDGPQAGLLRSKIEAMRLNARVVLAGVRADIGRAYAEASIFCHPALFEGFGLVAAEALAAGLPVVAFADCEGLNEFLRDGYNGVLVDRSSGVRGLADGLERLIQDEDLRTRLGANGPASVAAYTPEAYRDAWLELVRDVIEERPS